MAALEVLLGRFQHELATPLLTASGFARIAMGSAAGLPDVLDPLHRVVAGVDRARQVLGVVVDLAEDRDLGVVDLVALIIEQDAALAATGVELDVVPPTTSLRCHAVPTVLAEVVGGLLRVFAIAGARRVVVEGAGDVAASSLVLSFDGDGDGWGDAVLAAAAGTRLPTLTDVEDADGVATMARVATAVESQLGRVWLDPSSDRQAATLRLLSAPSDDASGSR